MLTALTRQEQQERTRKRLLEAADKEFSRDGFHAASLARIADRAGVTTGAVYASFSGKVDLFLQTYDEHITRRLAEIGMLAERKDTGGSGASAQAARQWLRRTERERGWLLAWFEFRIHAARDLSLNREVALRNRRLIEGVAALYESALARAGADDASEQGRDIARAFVALGNGYALERWNDPDRSPVRGLESASEAMIAGMWRAATDGAVRA